MQQSTPRHSTLITYRRIMLISRLLKRNRRLGKMRSNRMWLFVIVSAIPFALPSSSDAQDWMDRRHTCTPCAPGSQCSEVEIEGRTFMAVPDGALQDCIMLKAEVSRPAMLDKSSAVGQVLVKLALDRKGRIINAHCVSGPPIAYQAVLDSLHHWKFKKLKLPSKADGISGGLIVHFDFRSSP